MSTVDISPIELCPINFNKFERLNRLVGNVEETLLLSKIKFHQFATKLNKAGKPVIARSRKEISCWFNLSQRKTDRHLVSLCNKGLLSKSIALFYGKRKLFLSVSNQVNEVPINVKLLDFLVNQTGSLEAALVFSRIAFTCALTSCDINCCHEGVTFSYLKKSTLSEFVQVSIRKLDKLLSDLEEGGFLLKKNLVSNGKRQMHFNIPQSKIKELKESFQESFKGNKKYFRDIKLPGEHKACLVSNRKSVDNYITPQSPSCQNCRLEPAKMQPSIKLRTNKKKAINNTIDSLSQNKKTTHNQSSQKSVINSSLTKLSNKLTKRQTAYLQGSLKKVIQRHQVKISDPNSLLDQLTFALTQPYQRQGVSSFTHAVSRFMKILSEGNWRTPFGFYKHDSKGVSEKEIQLNRERDWHKVKQSEIEYSKSSQVLADIKNAYSSKKDSLTEKGVYYAKLIQTAHKEWKKTKDSKLESMINEWLYKIKELLNAGADRAVVTEVLNQVG